MWYVAGILLINYLCGVTFLSAIDRDDKLLSWFREDKTRLVMIGAINLWFLLVPVYFLSSGDVSWKNRNK